jgi:hypothetical protein
MKANNSADTQNFEIKWHWMMKQHKIYVLLFSDRVVADKEIVTLFVYSESVLNLYTSIQHSFDTVSLITLYHHRANTYEIHVALQSNF